MWFDAWYEADVSENEYLNVISSMEWTVTTDIAYEIVEYDPSGILVRFDEAGDFSVTVRSSVLNDSVTNNYTAIEIPDIGTSGSVTIDPSDMDIRYKFTPESDGAYIFDFVATDEFRLDVWDNFEYSNGYMGGSGSFELNLKKDVRYYFSFASTLEEDTAVVSFTVTKRTAPAAIDSIEIITYPIREFYYDTQLDEIDLAGLALIVTTKDGKIQDFSYDEKAFGNKINVTVNKDVNSDELGLVKINCGGKTAEFYLDIVFSTVKSIKINKAPSFVYTYGDTSKGYEGAQRGSFDYEDNYYYFPCEIEDLDFTVSFKDGSKKRYTGKDIDVFAETLEGNDCWLEYTDGEPTAIGKNKVTLHLQDKSVSYNVTVKKSNVKSIELLKGPTYNKIHTGFVPTMFGARLKVTYTNGKSETVNVSEKNSLINMESGDLEIVLSNGDKIVIEMNGDYYARMYDVKCVIPMTDESDESVYTDISAKKLSHNFANTVLVVTGADTAKMNIELSKLPEEDIILEEDTGFIYIKVFKRLTEYGYAIGTAIRTIGEDGVPAKYGITFGDANSIIAETAEYELTGISIKKKPQVIRYKAGDAIDPYGLVLNLEYSNGYVGTLKYYEESGISFSKVNTSKQGKKTVTVQYGGFKTSFDILVLDEFTDVPEKAWYYECVDYVSTFGMLQGTSDKTFSPDSYLTRAQFVQILANLEGIDTSKSNVASGYKDVAKGQWYTAAVKWASENEIVMGMGDGNFKPNDRITREQMCVMICNYVEKYLGCNFAKYEAGNAFKDNAKISDWAKDAVDKCQRANIINGVGDGRFAPKDYAKRCEGASLFMEFYNTRPYHENLGIIY